jgi:hypothetical protein
MAPDTQQNFLVAGMLLVEHNFFALFFLGGVILSVALGLWKPSRGAILLMVGFALLLFAFEYQKHIVDGLLEQTRGSLITERQSYRLEWLLDKTFGKILPPLFYFLGTVVTAVGGYMEFMFLKKIKNASARH